MSGHPTPYRAAKEWHVASMVVLRRIHKGDLITYDTRTRQFKITRRAWYRRWLRA